MTIFVGASDQTVAAGTHEFTEVDAPADSHLVLIHLRSFTSLPTFTQASGGGKFAQGPAAGFDDTAMWWGTPADMPVELTVAQSTGVVILGYQYAAVFNDDWPNAVLGSFQAIGHPGQTTAALDQFPIEVDPIYTYPTYQGYSVVEILNTSGSTTPTIGTPSSTPTVTSRLTGEALGVADDLNTTAATPTRGLRYNLGGTQAWACAPIILVGDNPTAARTRRGLGMVRG